ncbi:type II secretion system F family protein [Pseudoruegeria sp. SHC-113]|uniref:type II secretion system F family protein n=1 Tax=Pseudoruegeria sp. SHC-113 TaxID=2855439 RepID=UPI0021BB7989|nr:type II secretion system F family protein [Pseudoruegeria sp. SHC-113]MCT8161664.1 type II secretion system F family protein [Pseudoruegeria sp. SHC-113]
MRSFAYTAYSATGRRKRGLIVAESESDARRQLEARGLFASDLSGRSERRKGLGGRGLRGRLNADMQAVFTRQMAVLLASDIPVETALDIVREGDGGGSGPMAQFAMRAKARLLDGAPLSLAVEQAGGGFAPYYAAALRAGERSGDLDVVFGELADHMESAGADRAKLATALIYPGFVAAVSLVVCAVLMVNVAPEIVAMFEVTGAPLPRLTQIVLGVSDWIRAHFLWLLGGAVLGAVLFLLALRQPAFRARWHGLLLRLPVVGRLMRLSAAAQYLRTLALVISSRQTVLDATKSAGDVLTVARFRDEAEAVSADVRSGASLSAALQQLSVIPAVGRQLISAGERSARLGRMTERAAVMIESQLANDRKRVAALLDPILMMLVGAFVLVIVLAILLPIFDLQAAIG